MIFLYVLQHSYEYEYEGELFDETKMIGVFSSREKAQEVIEKFMLLPGFKDHPIDCFYIDKFELDKISGWDEGFIKW